MIKKLLLTFSFIALVTITYGGTTYMSQAGEKIVVSEELANTLNILKNLYKEGVITEEEFSKAKSILLNPDSGTTKEELSKLNKLYKEGIVAHIQIHDELDLSIEDDKQAKRIVDIMESAVELEVPNKVDYEFGKNWGDIYD